MNLIKEFKNVTTFIEDDVLKSHDISRMMIWSAGTEETTNQNINSYDPVAGRVNFTTSLGNATIKVLIID